RVPPSAPSPWAGSTRTRRCSASVASIRLGALPVAAAGAARFPTHLFVAHDAGVGVEADGAADAIALDAAVDLLRRAVGGGERAGAGLEVVLEPRLARRDVPGAGTARRHDVEVGVAPGHAHAADLPDLGLLPAADLVAVVDDARAGRQLEELRRELLQVR